MDSGVSMYLFYSLIYGFFCLCVIAPPTEFVSAGLTIQHIFSSFLGSEDMTFIEYHIKRTTVTAFMHSLLPLGKLWGAPVRWWISIPLIVIQYTMRGTYFDVDSFIIRHHSQWHQYNNTSYNSVFVIVVGSSHNLQSAIVCAVQQVYIIRL